MASQVIQLSSQDIEVVGGLERWEGWVPLTRAVAGGQLPGWPGLYRIRRIGWSGLDYIGQTGTGTMTLRKRISMLRGVYGPVMPYRDPHTAARGLWALRHQTGCEFEVSVLVVEETTQWRKTLEAVAITRYRLEWGGSPTLNFGRMPAGYRMSSANNAKLVLAGRRFRGGPSVEPSASQLPSLPPLTPAAGASTSGGWGGHRWQPWVPLRGVHLPAASVGCTASATRAGRDWPMWGRAGSGPGWRRTWPSPFAPSIPRRGGSAHRSWSAHG